MTDREKLIELLSEAEKVCFVPMWLPPEERLSSLFSQIADHLLAHGVTVQDNTEISDELLEWLRKAHVTVMTKEPTVEMVQEWISVKYRLPEGPLETVLVSNGKSVCVGVYSVVYDQFVVMCGRSRKAGKSFGVTHWMPLPEPPKGE